MLAREIVPLDTENVEWHAYHTGEYLPTGTTHITILLHCQCLLAQVRCVTHVLESIMVPFLVDNTKTPCKIMAKISFIPLKLQFFLYICNIM